MKFCCSFSKKKNNKGFQGEKANICENLSKPVVMALSGQRCKYWWYQRWRGGGKREERKTLEQWPSYLNLYETWHDKRISSRFSQDYGRNSVGEGATTMLIAHVILNSCCAMHLDAKSIISVEMGRRQPSNRIKAFFLQLLPYSSSSSFLMVISWYITSAYAFILLAVYNDPFWEIWCLLRRDALHNMLDEKA